MDEGKQTKVMVLSWSLIGVTFVFIIIFMLAKFLRDGRNMSEDLSRDRLEGYVSTWAGQLDSRVEHIVGETTALAEFTRGRNFELGGVETLAFASNIVEMTAVSHIYFCNGTDLICDETGAKVNTFPLDEDILAPPPLIPIKL